MGRPPYENMSTLQDGDLIWHFMTGYRLDLLVEWSMDGSVKTPVFGGWPLVEFKIKWDGEEGSGRGIEIPPVPKNLKYCSTLLAQLKTCDSTSPLSHWKLPFRLGLRRKQQVN